MEQDWEFAIDEKELREGKAVSVKVGKKSLLIVRAGGRIHAVSGKCPHYGAPLHKGVLHGMTLVCPWHNAQFELETGKMLLPPSLKDLVRYEVKVEGGKVSVRKAHKPEVELLPGTENKSYMIVGAGASGNACAVTLKMEGFAGKVLMITAEDELPYDRPNLSKDFLTGDAGPEWIPLEREEYYEKMGIEILKNTRVTGVDIKERRVFTEKGSDVSYDKLLLCTGSIPKKPKITGADLEGFFVLRSFGDARDIRKYLPNCEHAVILGSSFIGLEVAQALRKLGIKVKVVDPVRVPLERVFGERIGHFIKSLHDQHRVEFHLGVTASEISGNGRVSGVVLSNGNKLKADIVISGIGVVPAVDYLKNSSLVSNGAIKVDSYLETECKGIYASGDIALVPDPLTGEPRRVEHWAEAERQGQHAAFCMAGKLREYKETPFFWTRQYDSTFKYVGFAREFDAIAYRGDVESGKFIAGYYNGGVLRAASGLEMSEEIIVISELLKKGKNVPEELFQDEEKDLMDLLS